MQNIAFQLIFQQCYSLNKLHVFRLFSVDLPLSLNTFNTIRQFSGATRRSVTLCTGKRATLQISDDLMGLVRKT